MEVLGFVFKAIVFLVVAVIGLALALLGLLILWGLWPAIGSGILGIWLWQNGHDSWGVVAVVVGLIANLFWLSSLQNLNASSGPSPDWLMKREFEQGKRKLYDADGNVTGYVDRDSE